MKASGLEVEVEIDGETWNMTIEGQMFCAVSILGGLADQGRLVAATAGDAETDDAIRSVRKLFQRIKASFAEEPQAGSH